MTIIRNVVLAVLVVASAIPTQAQQLTQPEIEQAVAVGLKTRPNRIGLSMSSWSPAWTNTQLRAYTPITWVQLLAAEAKAALKPFSIKDVDSNATKPVLRVQFRPGGAVKNIVLQSADKQQPAIQPTETRVCGQQPLDNGGRMVVTCFEAQFSMAEVRTLTSSGNDEFLVTVAATAMSAFEGQSDEVTVISKDFKVKRGDLAKLPGLK